MRPQRDNRLGPDSRLAQDIRSSNRTRPGKGTRFGRDIPQNSNNRHSPDSLLGMGSRLPTGSLPTKSIRRKRGIRHSMSTPSQKNRQCWTGSLPARAGPCWTNSRCMKDIQPWTDTRPSRTGLHRRGRWRAREMRARTQGAFCSLGSFYFERDSYPYIRGRNGTP